MDQCQFQAVILHLLAGDTSGVPTTGNVGVGIPEFQQTQQESLTITLLQMQDTLVSQVTENQRILQQLQQSMTIPGSKGITNGVENNPNPVRNMGSQQNELHGAIESVESLANKDQIHQPGNVRTNTLNASQGGDQMMHAQDRNQRGSGLLPLHITHHPEPRNQESGPGCSVILEGVENSNQSGRRNETSSIPIAAKLLPPFTGEKEEKWEVWFAQFEAVAMAHN